MTPATPAVIRSGRVAAERWMRDRCVVRRLTGTTEDDDFVIHPVYEVVYGPDTPGRAGRCKIQTYDAYERTAESAGASQTTQRSNVHFPVGAFRMEEGDVLTVLSSVDPMLVGRSYRIAQEAPVKSLATAYRVFIDENLGQEVPPWTG
ncbi:DUF6093 family protein [Georgenia sp. MJ206]|uniref:DUF6093 family protein n=1 Tax=Georgenia wangjunii TaxID=3117730 RepID=UPI002F25F08E